EGAGALGSLGALKASTHHVITMFLYPLRAVEAACALDVDAMRALDLMEAVRALDLIEVEAVVALDVVGLSLNIIISESLIGYLTSLYQTKSSSSKKLHHWILQQLLQALPLFPLLPSLPLATY
nr:hypothetical protein [Tanacetum cinerariifolium]